MRDARTQTERREVLSFNDENDSGRVRDACGENEEKIVYNLFENDETYAVATGPEPDYRSLPPGAGRRVHRVGLRGDRSLGTSIKINEYLTIYGFDYLIPASMVFSIWLCGAR